MKAFLVSRCNYFYIHLELNSSYCPGVLELVFVGSWKICWSSNCNTSELTSINLAGQMEVEMLVLYLISVVCLCM